MKRSQGLRGAVSHNCLSRAHTRVCRLSCLSQRRGSALSDPNVRELLPLLCLLPSRTANGSPGTVRSPPSRLNAVLSPSASWAADGVEKQLPDKSRNGVRVPGDARTGRRGRPHEGPARAHRASLLRRRLSCSRHAGTAPPGKTGCLGPSTRAPGSSEQPTACAAGSRGAFQTQQLQPNPRSFYPQAARPEAGISPLLP